jgi:6-phosphogluconate dehydrogenase
MQIGMIGLGRMGANMVERLMRAGHEAVVYARRPEAMRDLVSISESSSNLSPSRAPCG